MTVSPRSFRSIWVASAVFFVFCLGARGAAIAEVHCTACADIPNCVPICWEFRSVPRGDGLGAGNPASARPHSGPGAGASLDRSASSLIPNSNLESLIQRIAQDGRVDPALVQAVVRAESGFDPFAVSRRGAEGLMQLMPMTARAVGVKNSFVAEQNLRGGVTYLRQMLDLFAGDTRLALAAYNAGPQVVLSYGGIPPYKETRVYVERVLKYRDQIRQSR